ncbi:MAG: hypothetical protein JWN51_862 [Phycisphaerales bacterium]|nr:hypothetical protein [Phycisphaerales bacterium]
MARSARVAPGGVVFHVLSRGVGRRTLFRSERDYAGFEAVLEASLQAVPLRLLPYCLMPNHWHLILWPARHGQLLAASKCRVDFRGRSNAAGAISPRAGWPGCLPPCETSCAHPAPA